eukprot:1642545-Rhodomonas_salina.1
MTLLMRHYWTIFLQQSDLSGCKTRALETSTGGCTKLNCNYLCGSTLMLISIVQGGREVGLRFDTDNLNGLDILDVRFDSHRLPEPVALRESERLRG